MTGQYKVVKSVQFSTQLQAPNKRSREHAENLDTILQGMFGTTPNHHDSFTQSPKYQALKHARGSPSYVHLKRATEDMSMVRVADQRGMEVEEVKAPTLQLGMEEGEAEAPTIPTQCTRIKSNLNTKTG